MLSDAQALADAALRGAMPALATVRLAHNSIGDVGATAFTSALARRGALPRLREVDLQGNQICPELVSALEASTVTENPLHFPACWPSC